MQQEAFGTSHLGFDKSVDGMRLAFNLTTDKLAPWNLRSRPQLDLCDFVRRQTTLHPSLRTRGPSFGYVNLKI